MCLDQRSAVELCPDAVRRFPVDAEDRGLYIRRHRDGPEVRKWPDTVKLFRDASIAVREGLANTSGYRLPEHLYPMRTFIPHEEFQKMLSTFR
jgi:hypothetical protein